jgi:hypothetical protein
MNTDAEPLDLFLDVSSELLSRGYKVRFRAHGRSMQPTIREGEAIMVEPVEPAHLSRGDIILYRVDRGILAHRIVGLKRGQGENTILRVRGDAWGSSAETVEATCVAGKVVSVERNGLGLELCSRQPTMWRTARGFISRLKRWLRGYHLCCALVTGILLSFGQAVLAVEVTIDATVSNVAASHNGSSPTGVFISDQTGYAFYRDSTGSCVYRKTTNGGGSWSAAVTVDAQTNCFRIAVWYDRWTPGDSTGTIIHISTMDNHDLWYTRLDTSSDVLTTAVNASGSAQGGSFGAAGNISSITKGTDGDVYMGVHDSSDSFVLKCASGANCTNAASWAEAGTNPLDLVADNLILMPLSGGNIMAIRWDISAEDIQSKVYHDATNTWDASWTTIDANATHNSTYDAAFGATVDPATGFIFLAYAADISSVGGNDDIRTAIYNGASWTTTTSVVTDSSNGKGITGVKIAMHERTGAVYVVYTARTGGASTANIFWKRSTDGMATWSSEQGPVASASGNIYGMRVNILSDERLYATWVNHTIAGPPLLGNTIEDLGPTAVHLVSFTAVPHDGGVLLQWQTSYEVDNLGFHVYREDGGQRFRLTPSLVAGSALFAGAGTALTAGRSYAWSDTDTLMEGHPRYWLEEVDLHGQRTWHGPVDLNGGGSIAQGDRPGPSVLPATLLSRLGRAAALKREGASNPEWSPITQRLGHVPGGWTGLSETTSQQQQMQWALAARPAVKLGLRTSGWYRVEQSALVAAGLDPGVDPRYLQLFVDGQEVPIVVTGAGGKQFIPGDAIEFYGIGLDTPWTDIRTYWLVAGEQPGKRVAVVRGQKPAGQAPASFPLTIEWKPRMLYFANLKNGEGENFFGPVITTEPVEQAFSVQHLDPAPSGEAWLEVTLQGATAGPHRVTVMLNGSALGALTFDGQKLGVTHIPFAQTRLQPGENLLTLVAEAGETDVSLVDSPRRHDGNHWRLHQPWNPGGGHHSS